MPKYIVSWVIDDEDSESPLEAARRALEAQRRPGSTATVFDVRETATGQLTRVDLDPVSNGAVVETLEESGHWCDHPPVLNEDGELVCSYCESWWADAHTRYGEPLPGTPG